MYLCISKSLAVLYIFFIQKVHAAFHVHLMSSRQIPNQPSNFFFFNNSQWPLSLSLRHSWAILPCQKIKPPLYSSSSKRKWKKKILISFFLSFFCWKKKCLFLFSFGNWRFFFVIFIEHDGNQLLPIYPQPSENVGNRKKIKFWDGNL